jgi:hypothetical protein
MEFVRQIGGEILTRDKIEKLYSSKFSENFEIESLLGML